MPRAIVKAGVTHRTTDPEGGLGQLAQAGQVIIVTQNELDSFSDKLEPLEERPQVMKPVMTLDVLSETVVEPEVVAKTVVEPEVVELYDPLTDPEWPDIIKPAVSATDAARLAADEAGIDITEVDGTGQGGRITKGDVDRYVAEG